MFSKFGYILKTSCPKTNFFCLDLARTYPNFDPDLNIIDSLASKFCVVADINFSWVLWWIWVDIAGEQERANNIPVVGLSRPPLSCCGLNALIILAYFHQTTFVHCSSTPTVKRHFSNPTLFFIWPALYRLALVQTRSRPETLASLSIGIVGLVWKSILVWLEKTKQSFLRHCLSIPLIDIFFRRCGKCFCFRWKWNWVLCRLETNCFPVEAFPRDMCVSHFVFKQPVS